MATQKEEVAKSGEVPVHGGGLAGRRHEINRLFDRLGGMRWPRLGGRRQPDLWPASAWSWDPFAGLEWPAALGEERGLGRADLSETDEGYELQVDLPGLKKENIEVELSEGILTISGERSDQREDERKGYYLSERSYGAVRRSFRVPESVEADRIKAEFKDGVLTLTMPKSEQAKASSRRIEVG